MIPPAATPPTIRLMKSTVRLGASADATRQSARLAVATLISMAFPTASPVGPRSGWLRPNGSAKAEESRAEACETMKISFEGRVAIVTGARNGLGRAHALGL